MEDNMEDNLNFFIFKSLAKIAGILGIIWIIASLI